MTLPQLIEHGGDGGYFRIFVTPPRGRRRDVTLFRGAPTRIEQLTTTDPFGDATGSLSFPQITGMDKPGSGDLDWLVPDANVDIQYHYADGSLSEWTWEGMTVSEDIPDQGYTLTMRGALYQLDDFRAAPWYPQYPIPYELLLKDAFDPSLHPTLRTGRLVVKFPDDWNTVVPEFDDPDYLWFLRPYGVKPGEKWSGLVSRSTGGWEPTLTGYVQGLLGVMYTEEGQWTITKRRGRVPMLHVREHVTTANQDTPVIHYGSPGVVVNMTRDFSQSANVIYGAGQDLNGTAFSGQYVGARSGKSFYEPFAALPHVHPSSDNPRYDARVTRRETRLQFPSGVDELAGRDIAAAHLRRFANPGYTGSITPTSDPLINGRPIPRVLLRAGDNLLIKGFRGTDMVVHITECSISPHSEGSVSLTVDTKFRDALTVHEVRARTRDALDPINLMQVGKFSTTVQDLILPWSYTQGSGCIPSGGDHDSTEFFTKRLGERSRFPWTDFTTKYPPRKYPQYYIKIGPQNSNADKNWGNLRSDGIAQGFPIRMSQSGSIRLIQIAAYDADGNVVPVRFHFAVYNNSGVTSRDMPRIPKDGTLGAMSYKEGQAYPFFAGAFERLNPDGTETTDPLRLLHDSAGLVVGWGNYYEEAGYSPGKHSAGNPRTGLLTDEAAWSFDTTQDPDFDKYDAKNTREATTTGLLYGMVYADGHGNRPIYIMGRLWRAEAGA